MDGELVFVNRITPTLGLDKENATPPPVSTTAIGVVLKSFGPRPKTE